MSRVSPNVNFNIEIKEGREFVQKLRRLGFVLGDIYINPTGPFPFDYEPLDQNASGVANLIVFAYGDFHNVKLLKLMYGPGELKDLQELYADLKPTGATSFGDFLLNIPGVADAVEKAVKEVK